MCVSPYPARANLPGTRAVQPHEGHRAPETSAEQARRKGAMEQGGSTEFAPPDGPMCVRTVSFSGRTDTNLLPL